MNRTLVCKLSLLVAVFVGAVFACRTPTSGHGEVTTGPDGIEVEVDWYALALEAPEASAAAGGPVHPRPPRIQLPPADTLTRVESALPDANGWSGAVLPIKTSTDGMHLSGKLYVQQGGRELSISNGGQQQLNVSIDGCGFRCTPTNTSVCWLSRWYTVTGRVNNCFFKQDPKEHAIYWSPGPGNLEFTECLFQNIGAQGIQLRLGTSDTGAAPESSPYWLTERTILLDRVVMLECGQQRGAGRAAFAFSPKSPGPNTDITMRDCFLQTINQTNVDGKGHDSFGGACFETCRSVTIERCTFDFKNPANGAIAFFMYDNKPSTSLHRAPHDSIVVRDSLINNDIGIRVADTVHVDISNCTGTGVIQLWKVDPNADRWLNFAHIPVTTGYAQ